MRNARWRFIYGASGRVKCTFALPVTSAKDRFCIKIFTFSRGQPVAGFFPRRTTRPRQFEFWGCAFAEKAGGINNNEQSVMVQRGLAHKSSLGATLTRSRAVAASFGAARSCLRFHARQWIRNKAAAWCMCASEWERGYVCVRERESITVWEQHTNTFSRRASLPKFSLRTTKLWRRWPLYYHYCYYFKYKVCQGSWQ